MSIITLISDWGLCSHYTGAVKGSILRQIPDAVIVDISHQVRPFDILQASFILKNAWIAFPEGTIHLIGINTEASIETPHLVVKYKGHYFIGADNGILSLVVDVAESEIYEIDIIQDSDYFTFSTRDVFVKAAAHIVNGYPLSALGQACKELNKRIPLNPVEHNDSIVGRVIFIDNYENVFVNIDEKTFKKVGKNRPFEISFRSPGMEINNLSKSYQDVVPGEKLALFGATGLLEIAINRGNASGLLGLKPDDTVVVSFK